MPDLISSRSSIPSCVSSKSISLNFWGSKFCRLGRWRRVKVKLTLSSTETFGAVDVGGRSLDLIRPVEFAYRFNGLFLLTILMRSVKYSPVHAVDPRRKQLVCMSHKAASNSNQQPLPSNCMMSSLGRLHEFHEESTCHYQVFIKVE